MGERGLTKRLGLRNGKKLKFWKNGWCGDESLNKIFPRLLSIASAKEA